ncbi:hypothetical protein CHUAL_004798 [Chamberlinius hualienensis]
MAAPSELELLERVFLCVGTAETDEQLQSVISRFLLPVLLKLSSQQEGVRKRVMELLVHINKRIKSRPKVQLPVEALLLQYQDPQATSFVTNFTIIYLKLGYPRLDSSKRAELIPRILNCLEGKPPSHQDSLLLMLLPVLNYFPIPSDPEKCKLIFNFNEKPQIAKLLLDFLLDVLLLPYGTVMGSKSPSVQVTVTVESSNSGSAGSQPPSSAPSGLSEYAFKRITGETPMLSEELEQVKLGIVKFLKGGFFNEDDVVPHLVVASADTRHSVVSAVGMELQRSKSLTSTAVINTLYFLFLGTDEAGKDKIPVKTELKRNPVSLRIRMKIMPFLVRSTKAAAYFPSNLQVVFESLFGKNTYPKLKLLAVQFVRNVIGSTEAQRMNTIGPIILSGMERVIKESSDDKALRSAAYTVIGELGCLLPNLVNEDFALLNRLFKALNEEDSDTKISVQSALNAMMKSFCNLESHKMKIMENLFAANMNETEPAIRLTTVQYLSCIFPPNHIPSRYLLLLAAGDNKEEVCAEASKILNTVPSKSNDVDAKYPSFVELVHFIYEKGESKAYEVVREGGRTLPFPLFTCTEMLTYMRLCLIHASGLTFEPKTSDDMVSQAPAIAKYVQQLISQGTKERESIQQYINFITHYLSVMKSWNAMYYLLEVVAVAPTALAFQFKEKLNWIKNLIFDNHKEMRIYASQLFAVVAAYCLEPNDFNSCVVEFKRYFSDKNIHIVHGSVLALGYLLGRKSRLGDSVIDGLANFIEELVNLLKSSSQLIVSSACTSLGEIGRHGSFPLPDGSITDLNSLTKLSVVRRLVDLVKSSKQQDNVYEKAAFAVSCICAGDQTFPSRRDVMSQFFKVEELRDMELQFTVGEALGWICRGSNSSLVRDIWTVPDDPLMYTESEVASSDLVWLLTEICVNHANSPNSFSRQAACVWLVSVLKRCHTMKSAKDHSESLQKVFISLLAENNEITQDCASKGLSLIYDYSDEKQKTEMISVLVESLTTGRRPNQQVTGDTKLFEEGTLGVDPHGGSISTYKEICSLASDLNQPDLIYKFMHLANDNAIWNSKKGAAFGFGMIADKAGAQLQAHLSKILPKLYRYQFDPNPKIRKSMTGIWHAIVTDPQKMVDQYIKEILADLKVNLTSGLWRTRESSCLAVADLLRGRQLDNVIDDLPSLWEICFRVRDDIKESVRIAAETALNVLNKVTIKLCDSNAGSVGNKAIASILPVLLNSGLTSPVAEVKAVSLATLSEIGKGAGVLLKPHIPIFVIALLESLSTMELQELSYLSVRFGNEKGAQEKLDSARVSAARSSPMMETINRCLLFIDEEVLSELIPRLIDLIKNSVGLGTKTGCSHFVVMLTQQCSNELKPHSGKLLAALLYGLNDLNVVVRKSYAVAIGHAVKTAKDSSIEKLIERLTSSYLEKGEVAQQTTGYVLNAIAKQNPDIMKAHSTQVLPLVFLAMHFPKIDNEQSQNENKMKELWEEVWIDLTPSTETGIRLHISEIVEVIRSASKSQAWSMKAKAVAAINTVATTMKSSLGSPYLEQLLNTVLGELPGRTWSGKEYLLRAISAICISCNLAVLDLCDKDPGMVTKIAEALIKECNKNTLPYKVDAIRNTAEIFEGLNIDRFQDIFSIAKAAVSKDKDDSSDDDYERKSQNNQIEETIFKALGSCWPKSEKETQEMFQQELCDFLISNFDKFGLKGKSAILACLLSFVKKLYILEHTNTQDDYRLLKQILLPIIDKLCDCKGVKSTSIKCQVVDVFEVILSKLPVEHRLRILDVIKDDLGEAISEMAKDSQTELRSKCDIVSSLLNCG